MEECEELQKRVRILQDELEKMQNEFNAQIRNSVSSPDSITSQEINQSLGSTSWNKASVLSKNRIMSESTYLSGAVKVSNLCPEAIIKIIFNQSLHGNCPLIS